MLTAETLVRGAIVEREIRERYAHDSEIHAATRERAAAALAGKGDIAELRALADAYVEQAWAFANPPEIAGAASSPGLPAPASLLHEAESGRRTRPLFIPPGGSAQSLSRRARAAPRPPGHAAAPWRACS